MSLSDTELAVERDWLLEHGRSVEEVERRERTLLAAITIARFAWFAIRLSPGEVCPSCRRTGERARLFGHDSRCELALAAALLSEPENAAGASTHRAPGETR